MQTSDTRLICSQYRRPCVNLRSVKWVLGDRKSMNGAYYSTFIPRIIGAFQRLAINSGNGGVGTHNITTNGRNGCMCVYSKFLLGAES